MDKRITGETDCLRYLTRQAGGGFGYHKGISQQDRKRKNEAVKRISGNSALGIVSIAGGILLIKTLENPNDFILTLSYICIGVGCGVFGHGMGNFVAIKSIQNNPEIKIQMDIVRKDERNIAISNHAKAKAYDLMTYSFGALLLIFTLMGIDLIPLLLLVFIYLIIQIYAVYYRIKFDKEM